MIYLIGGAPRAGKSIRMNNLGPLENRLGLHRPPDGTFEGEEGRRDKG